jgi:transcriptional regulator NrdR family protein
MTCPECGAKTSVQTTRTSVTFERGTLEPLIKRRRACDAGCGYAVWTREITWRLVPAPREDEPVHVEVAHV